MNKRLFRIAWEGLKGRKSQTAVLVVLLTLSFAFIVLTLSITDSFTATEQEAGYDAYGQWNIAVSASDLSKKEAQQQDWIKAVASLQILGISRMRRETWLLHWEREKKNGFVWEGLR